MISFCDGKYTAERDRWQWVLHEWYEYTGKKTGETMTGDHETYHANLAQVCHAVIDREAGRSPDAAALEALLGRAVNLLTQRASIQLQETKHGN